MSNTSWNEGLHIIPAFSHDGVLPKSQGVFHSAEVQVCWPKNMYTLTIGATPQSLEAHFRASFWVEVEDKYMQEHTGEWELRTAQLMHVYPASLGDLSRLRSITAWQSAYMLIPAMFHDVPCFGHSTSIVLELTIQYCSWGFALKGSKHTTYVYMPCFSFRSWLFFAEDT